MEPIQPGPRPLSELQALFTSCLRYIHAGIHRALRAHKSRPDSTDIYADAIGLAWRRAAQLDAQGRRWWLFCPHLGWCSAKQALRGEGVAKTRKHRSYAPRDRRTGRLLTPARLERGPNPDPIQWPEALAVDYRTGPDELAAEREHFALWFEQLEPRHQRLIRVLLAHWRTKDAARELGVCVSRVVQIRNWLERSYLSFVRNHGS